ncbi:MAG TPA: serine/threonine-protein kinase [Gemmatimonadales bacterium]|nr:serine/threonine-protein kinase [Gemmatimonadales bacterium]
MNDHTARLNAALPGRYQIERQLGRGGMATVYLARDLRHERLVALKVLHPELASALGPERFLREVRTVARLQHPHILSVHDSGEAAGLLWFTMPFIEGESLRDRLKREHQLPLEVAIRIAQEAARALDYAHRHSVIHRDIKPENILLTSDGDTLVADFGIGRAVGAGAPEDRLTETGVVVGTPAYMSPEQAAGERELDGRTDVYSLGVVLYEMLAGEPPFTGPTAQAILARRFTEAPRPIRIVRDTVPQEVELAVMRALARLPADRFATAGSFAEALDTARHSSAPALTVERSRLPPARMGTGARKRWVAGLLGALVAVVLLVVLIRSRAGANAELDSSLIAVAPFDVLDSRLGLWREGMVDLLSRNLDGAGPLRTVSPTVVVRRWSGRADPQSAADLGRRTGAGLALYGSLLGAGRDSARMRVTLLDVQQKRALEEWDLLDAADRVDRLGDSLTVRVLQGLGRSRPIGSVRRAGFGSTSLPAIKAFLQGEQHLRRSEWDSALGYYERAVRIDSTFPQALRRVGATLGWIRTGFDTLSIAYALRAGAHNRGLPPRDSLLTASDSLLASLFEDGVLAQRADSGWGSRLIRLFSTLERATSSYPDDPEAWYLRGEAEAHYGAYAGHSYEQQLHTFDRVIALDPDFAPAYIHPIETLAPEGFEEMQRYLKPYLALNPQDVNADGIRLVQTILSSPDSDVTRQIAQVPGASLFTAFLAVVRLPDSGETAVQIARRMSSRRWSEPPIDDSVVAQRQFERSLLSRGHLREWRRVAHSAPPQMFAEAALLGGLPADSVAAAYQRRLSGPVGPLMVQAFPWWTIRRDTTSLRKAAIRADSMARSPGSSNPQLGAYVSGAAEAYLALARGDSVLALNRFRALSHAKCPGCQLDRLTAAQLMVNQRQDREAWPLLQSAFPSGALPSAILWTLLRGRVAERIGERDRAIRSYAWVAGMWRNADPELQPYVAEAREGLARLTAERK